MIATRDTLGIGIYSPAEAAFYARVRTQTLNRWVFGDAHGDSVVKPQIAPDDDDRVITFLDFIQALAIRAIRTQYPKISLHKIRKAVDLVEERLGIKCPFAREHKSFIYDEREIALEVDGKLIQISGINSGNLMIGPIAELYLKRIHFGEDGFAAQYVAWGDNRNPIVMDPKRRFGEPIVASCGYTAQTLWDASIVEGGLEAAAKAYGVKIEEVTAACDYYDHLASAA
ncbi:MAG: hypothetical protein ACKV2Q_32565 [Planctomycetaceae bacterium]